MSLRYLEKVDEVELFEQEREHKEYICEQVHLLP